jgi:hypothetical protein
MKSAPDAVAVGVLTLTEKGATRPMSLGSVPGLK